MEVPAHSFRPATPDDFEAMARIAKQGNPSPWAETQFSTELDKSYSQTLVLTDDETDTRVLGYIVFWILDGDCHILDVAVAAEFRKQGLGEKLVREAIKQGLRGEAKQATLEVRKSNAAAIQLYQKLGFLVTRVAKSHYSNGEDAYMMTLDFVDSTLKI